MEYNRLGATGLEVSRICLGMMSYGSSQWQPWVLPASEGTRFVRLALDKGINFFDTADFYSLGASEESLGEAVATLTQRDQVVLATKVGLPMHPGPNGIGLSRKHIFASVDASLRRLKTDYIDLYQIHRWDEGTPIEETVEALNDLVRAGKVLYLGASNFFAWQLAKAEYTGRLSGFAGFNSMQIQYNLAFREEEREMIPFCRAEGIGLMVYSPLARGWLAGNRLAERGTAMTEREAQRAKNDGKAAYLYGSAGDRQVLERLIEIAAARGVPPARMAMSWVLSHAPVNALIAGALEAHHLDEAEAALALKLTPEEIVRLEEPYLSQPYKDDGLQSISQPAKG